MKRNSNYSTFSQFGSNNYSPVNDPLTYCIGNRSSEQNFLHGSSSNIFNGQNGKNCQVYLAEYCASEWDEACKVARLNSDRYYPDTLINTTNVINSNMMSNLTAGDALVYNTAKIKYLKSMGNCKQKFEQFDPNVANSPLISYWVSEDQSRNCIPVFAVDPNTIDSDIVMDEILAKPIIAIDILINIFNTMKKDGSLDKLNGTKLGNFFASSPIFKNKKK
jgi:hypothetical protein